VSYGRRCSPFYEYVSWYTSTVANSGISPFIQSLNLLSIAKNSVRAAVLAEPFPWTVNQGVTLLLSSYFKELYLYIWKISTQTRQLEPYGVTSQFPGAVLRAHTGCGDNIGCAPTAKWVVGTVSGTEAESNASDPQGYGKLMSRRSNYRSSCRGMNRISWELHKRCGSQAHHTHYARCYPEAAFCSMSSARRGISLAQEIRSVR